MQNLTFNGRYGILQQIGIGGFGLTYLAEDLQSAARQKVVVKHLRPQITDEQTLNLANRLFQQEAEILYRLGGHPQIPSLIAHYKENGEFFLVQEFVEGQTIEREFTAGRKYNQKEIVQFLGQTLEILAFVHSNKVIHRDVKPANLIRRSSDGNIFLIDFGAVKQVNSAIAQTPQGATFSTITIGSHGYMPMEQMAGKPNFSSDLYALGLVVIQALTGIKPLELPKNATTNEIIWAHKAQLSPELERFISRLVRMDFRQRFISATEALASLNSIASQIGFFHNRPQPQTIFVQPIAAHRYVPPINVPQNQPAFIPPTVIVPTQNNAANYPRRFQHNVAPPPPKSSGFAIFFSFVGILFFLGFLFIAGKVLNFRWSSLRENTEESSSRNAPTDAKSANNPNLNLFSEGTTQVGEAKVLEKKAKTQFDWQEISKKYRRALNLLMTIEPSSPDYEPAQPIIAECKEKWQKAEELAAQPFIIIKPDSKPDSTYTPISSDDKKIRPKVTMPGKQKAQSYITYNYDDGRDFYSKVVTSEENNFDSRVEVDEYVGVKTNVVQITVGSEPLTFKAPAGEPRLKPGTYKATQADYRQTIMSYAISYNRFSCYQSADHGFTINSIIYNDMYQKVSFLDATFVLNCEGRKMMGRVHYDAR